MAQRRENGGTGRVGATVYAGGLSVRVDSCILASLFYQVSGASPRRRPTLLAGTS
jgi:hypothetical protein